MNISEQYSNNGNAPLKMFMQCRRAIRSLLPPTPDADESLIALLLNPKSAFSSQTRLLSPVIVRDQDNCPLASAILIIASRMPDTLQLAFLDLAPDAQRSHLRFVKDPTGLAPVVNEVEETQRASGSEREVRLESPKDNTTTSIARSVVGHARFQRTPLPTQGRQAATNRRCDHAKTALDFLLEQTQQEARRHGVNRIVIGLNGHVNNGLGFATKDIPSPCFGSPSQPAFYADWIRPHATHIHKLVSYSHPVKSFSFGKHARLLPSLFKRYQFRSANFRNLRSEIACYTDLNNACFKDHPFYYPRTREEDYELFRAFRPFLKPDNFIVAMDQNQPVGFLLWYPDLHELVSGNEPLGLRALWRYRVCKHAFSRCKIAEIGVLPSHQRKGVALGMMAECFRRISGHFSICDTGWILEENEDSKALNIRWTDAPHHTYEAYEIDLRGKAS